MSAERGARGFTLIETLVVVAISAGLVALMTSLYRAVGTSALALRSGQQEWLAQRQVRSQLQHLFTLRDSPLRAVSGASSELYFLSWRSRSRGTDGEPALAYLHYDAAARELRYHELPLPAWWPPQAAELDPGRLQESVRAARGVKLMTAVDELRFLFLAEGAADPQLEGWVDEWRAEKAPRLIQMKFNRAGRAYSIWFETFGIGA